MPLVTLCVRRQLSLPYQGRCPAGAEGWAAPAAYTPTAAVRKNFSTKNKNAWKTFPASVRSAGLQPAVARFPRAFDGVQTAFLVQ